MRDISDPTFCRSSTQDQVSHVCSQAVTAVTVVSFPQRKHLTHRPYVGVAVKLNSPPETFQGQLFCFLPLPPEKPSPTGLPVHVHGFFELSQNRRHLKWPTSEEADTEGPVDDALVWNRLLITEVLPRAYVMLVTQLVNSSEAESPFIRCVHTVTS